MELIKFNHKRHSELWDNFVKKHDLGSIYHLSAWEKIIEKTYNIKSQYFLINDNENIIGIAPFFKLKNPLKKTWISLPYVSYAGILSTSKISLKDFIKTIETPPKKIISRKLLQKNKDSKLVTMKISLNDTKDEFWQNLGKSQRKYVRKCEKEGFIFKTENDNIIDKFYDIYKKNLKRLGTPHHPKKFFIHLQEELKEKVIFFSVRDQKNDIVAVQLSFEFKKILYNFNGFVNPNFIQKRIGTLLAWGCIKYAFENKFVELDYGRSTVGTGPFQYKTQWLAEPHSLEYISLENSKLTNIEIPKGGALSKIWSNSPSFLTNYTGPFIRKFIP